jgi:hypothetical protein
MKSIATILIASFCYVNALHAQDTTKAEQADHHFRHCAATRAGTGLMMAGGYIVATAGIAGLVYGLSHNDHNKKDDNGAFVFIAFGAIGLNVAIDGLFVYILGRVYDHRHKDRFSVISTKNEVGLAYHF